MKKLLFFTLTILFCFATSCKIFEQNTNKDFFLETAKAFTKEKLKKLFPQSNFEADTTKVSGTFQMDKVRAILKSPKIRVFLTEKGEILTDKLDFFAKVSWLRISQDSVTISLDYKKKLYTPKYAQGNAPKN